MGLVNILGSYVYRTRYEDLPPGVVTSAKEKILDTLGGAFSVYKHDFHKPVFRALKKQGGRRESTVIGEGVKLPCGHAALLNGLLAYELSDLGPGSHPGCVVVPAALAVSEANYKTRTASGKDLILAVALGYEVMGRIGMAGRPMYKRGFSIAAVVGPLGAAAAASKLLGLDEATTINALSLSSVMGAGVQYAAKSLDYFVPLLVGKSVESGITAALVAREGFRGYDGIIEEELIPSHCDEYDLDLATRNLGRDFMIPKVGLKIHASCGHMHTATDAVLYLVQEHKIGAADVRQIRVRTHADALEHFVISEPKGGSSAKYNPPFCVAAAVLHGDTCGDRFVDSNLEDERVRQLMRKVVVEADPGLDESFENRLSAIVEITTGAGRTFARRVDFPQGSAQAPLSPREIRQKFERVTSGVLDKETTRKFIDFVGNLESAGEVNSLFHWLKARHG